MKTLSEIAQELNITVQYIYKKKSADAALAAAIAKGSTKTGRSVLLDDEAEAAIKQAFKKTTKSTNIHSDNDNQIHIVELLHEQLNQANKQIETLQQLLNQQQQITLHQQLLLEPPKKRGIFSIFKRHGQQGQV